VLARQAGRGTDPAGWRMNPLGPTVRDRPSGAAG
jgi:hypothetical protein